MAATIVVGDKLDAMKAHSEIPTPTPRLYLSVQQPRPRHRQQAGFYTPPLQAHLARKEYKPRSRVKLVQAVVL